MRGAPAFGGGALEAVPAVAAKEQRPGQGHQTEEARRAGQTRQHQPGSQDDGRIGQERGQGHLDALARPMGQCLGQDQRQERSRSETGGQAQGGPGQGGGCGIGHACVSLCAPATLPPARADTCRKLRP